MQDIVQHDENDDLVRLLRMAKPPTIVPFTNEIHKLLNDSVEKIAQEWIGQLQALRENTTTLENQLLACVAKTKDTIAKLHTLGEHIADEAKRGRDLCQRVGDELELLTEGERQ